MRPLEKRIARLEQAESEGQRPALVILHGEGFDPESLTGVDGVDLPRQDGERAGDYVARLGAHLRADKGRALPVYFATYGPDDLPDGPPEQEATIAMLFSTVPSSRVTGEVKATL